jgi:thioredoxin-related protein
MGSNYQAELIKSKEEYDAYLSNEEYIGIYYSSLECGVCNTMKPLVITVFGQNGLPLREVSINTLREIAAQQLILKSPTVVIYDRGREILRSSGFIDLNRLNSQIEMMLS